MSVQDLVNGTDPVFTAGLRRLLQAIRSRSASRLAGISVSPDELAGRRLTRQQRQRRVIGEPQLVPDWMRDAPHSQPPANRRRRDPWTQVTVILRDPVPLQRYRSSAGPRGPAFFSVCGFADPLPAGEARWCTLNGKRSARESSLLVQDDRDDFGGCAWRESASFVRPLSGHLFPSLSLALALRERGHEVVFVGFGDVGAGMPPPRDSLSSRRSAGSPSRFHEETSGPSSPRRRGWRESWGPWIVSPSRRACSSPIWIPPSMTRGSTASSSIRPPLRPAPSPKLAGLPTVTLCCALLMNHEPGVPPYFTPLDLPHLSMGPSAQRARQPRLPVGAPFDPATDQPMART